MLINYQSYFDYYIVTFLIKNYIIYIIDNNEKYIIIKKLHIQILLSNFIENYILNKKNKS